MMADCTEMLLNRAQNSDLLAFAIAGVVGLGMITTVIAFLRFCCFLAEYAGVAAWWLQL